MVSPLLLSWHLCLGVFAMQMSIFNLLNDRPGLSAQFLAISDNEEDLMDIYHKADQILRDYTVCGCFFTAIKELRL